MVSLGWIWLVYVVHTGWHELVREFCFTYSVAAFESGLVQKKNYATGNDATRAVSAELWVSLV